MKKKWTSGEVLLDSLNVLMTKMGSMIGEARNLTRPGMAVVFTVTKRSKSRGEIVSGAILLAGSPEQNRRVFEAVRAVEREVMLENPDGFVASALDDDDEDWRRVTVMPGTETGN